MENRTIIIILVAIIIILSGAIGFALLNPLNAKEPCKVLITSDKEQYEGGELSIVLADLNKTPISKEIVNVTITDSKGKIESSKDMGQRKLAYPINKEINGFYYVVDFSASQETVAELNRRFRLDENIVRHMIIRLDEE